MTDAELQQRDALAIIDRVFGRELNTPEAQEQMDYYGLLMDVAQLLYDLREAAGADFDRLAELTGVPAGEIELVEQCGHRGDFFTILWKVARALGYALQFGAVSRLSDAAPAAAESPKELVQAA
jgi:hypothetical protein